MRSPFFSEGEGYQFVLLTVAAFAAIAAASLLGGPWAGVPVWAVLTISTVIFYARRGRAGRRIRTAPAHIGASDEHRVLVLALDTVATDVADTVRGTSGRGSVEAFVVCPARVSSLRHWTSNIDGARAQAQQTLEEILARFRDEGIEARGAVGDEDPVRAIEDALRTFGADEIVVWAGPEGGNAVEEAQERFALPIRLRGAVIHGASQAAAR
jgi:hypothetical protein